MSILGLSKNQTNLSNVSHEDIELTLYTILTNNKEKVYDDRTLYYLVLDEHGYKSGALCHNFKHKFYMVLRCMNSNVNIKVIKNNNKYTAFYSNTENCVQLNYVPRSTEYENIDLQYKASEIIEFVNNSMPEELENCMSYIDSENGNTAYHDLVKDGSIKVINKLIETDKMNFTIINNENLTPLDYIGDVNMSKIFIKDLYLKNIKQNDEIEMLKSMIKKQNDEINKIINQSETDQKNYNNLMYLFDFSNILVL